MQNQIVDNKERYLVVKPLGGRRALRRRSWRSKIIDALGEVFFTPLKLVAPLSFVTAAAREEARTISITENAVEFPHLPSAFEGLRVVFLTDLHCSRETPADFLEQVVSETNRLKPDVILLGGDYVTQGTEYIQPVARVLSGLKARFGVYGVLGNHDYWDAPEAVRLALKQAGVVDVTNGGRWLTIGGSRLRIAGVGDLWEDKQDLNTALAGVRESDAVILLSHNPDYAMKLSPMRLNDRRVGLVLSGHTHGGQILLPRIGALITNSGYGRRLVSGMISFGSFRLYVSRGIGTVVAPLRYGAPPEIAVLTLRSPKAS